MNQRIWSSVPAVLLATVLGTASSSYAQPTIAVDRGSSIQYQELAGDRKAELSSETESQSPQMFLKSRRSKKSGMASWYGTGSNALTGAHLSLPFGTRVRVTNLNNNRSVVVRINDRGPFIGGRVIDVSTSAARVLGIIQSGVAPVRIDVLGR